MQDHSLFQKRSHDFSQELAHGNNFQAHALSDSQMQNEKLSPQLPQINSNSQLNWGHNGSNFGQYTPEQQLHLLMQSVQNSEVLDVRTILNYYKSYNPISLVNFKDNKSYSLLHSASFNNQPKIVDLLLEYEKSISDHKTIASWINSTNSDQFTALHFAAYRGSIRILELLTEEGADLFITNAQGQNSFAIAAQGDQVLAMVWLKIRGVPFLATDEKGGTSLHWASFYGSEFAVHFMLSWITDDSIINKQDQDGMTALHLAAMTGNVRIVKKLLLRGANRQLKDSKGCTAADTATESQYLNITTLLQENNCLLEFLNIKTSLKKIESSSSQLVLFFVMYMFSLLGTITFVYPLLKSDGWIVYLSSLLFLLGLVVYIVTFFTDPGYIKKSSSLQEMFDLLQAYEPWEVCPECIIYKPKRSRHCEICRRCVRVYDHHCPWINNCIGAGNYLYFFIFLLLLIFNMLHIIVLNGSYLESKYDLTNSNKFGWFNGSTSEVVFICKIAVSEFFCLNYLDSSGNPRNLCIVCVSTNVFNLRVVQQLPSEQNNFRKISISWEIQFGIVLLQCYQLKQEQNGIE